MSKVTIPAIKDILKTGMQFGHNSSRWNPKMAKYIFDNKNGIHIVDVVKTRELLANAVALLEQVAKKEEVVIVGAKRQAAGLVESEAQRVGAHFVVNRWPGGLFTNFDMVKKSLYRLRSLEKQFEEGVEGRTKYEVMQMKNEWARLNRLYGGIKSMEKLPGAMVVIDPRYERVAVKEARLVGIPVVALTDTNCDPDMVDYIIPGNDDALRSIELVITTLADAIFAGNEGKGVKHELKNYVDLDVEIRKADDEAHEEIAEVAEVEESEQPKIRVKSTSSAKGKAGSGKGILERVKEEAAAQEQDDSDEDEPKPKKKKAAPKVKKETEDGKRKKKPSKK